MSCRVLVVDDDPDVRTSLSDVLEFHGYVVASAIHGQDALNQMELGFAPDLILLDLNMPVMNGQQFLSHLPANRPPPSVVVVTAASERENLGPVEMTLEKPLELDTLLHTARQYCAAAGRTPSEGT